MGLSVKFFWRRGRSVIAMHLTELSDGASVGTGVGVAQEHTGFSRLWRSAILPGWGQLQAERPAKAAVFFFGSLFTAAAAAGYAADSTRHQRRYDSAVLFGFLAPELPAESVALPGLLAFDRATSAREKGHSAQRRYAAGGSLLALAFLTNLADAYFFNRDEVLARREGRSRAAREQPKRFSLDLTCESVRAPDGPSALGAPRLVIRYRMQF